MTFPPQQGNGYGPQQPGGPPPGYPPQQPGGYGPYPPPKKNNTGVIVGVGATVLVAVLALVLVLVLNDDDDGKKGGTAGGGGTFPEPELTYTAGNGNGGDEGSGGSGGDSGPGGPGGGDSGPGSGPGSGDSGSGGADSGPGSGSGGGDSGGGSGGGGGAGSPGELALTIARIIEDKDVDAVEDHACNARDIEFFERDLGQLDKAIVTARPQAVDQTSDSAADVIIKLTVDGQNVDYPISMQLQSGAWCAHHEWSN